MNICDCIRNRVYSQNNLPYTCDEIMVNAMSHFNTKISHDIDFIEHWNRYNRIIKDKFDDISISYSLPSDSLFFKLKSLKVTNQPPALGEPYFLSFSELSVSEYIVANPESLYHPLLDTWISNEEDVYQKLDCSPIETLSLSHHQLSHAHKIVLVDAVVNTIYGNEERICIQLSFEYPAFSSTELVEYSVSVMMFLSRSNLELVDYGLGSFSGIRSKVDYTIDVNYVNK